MRLYIDFWKNSFDFKGFSDAEEYFVPWIFHIVFIIIPFPFLFVFGATDTFILISKGYVLLAAIPTFSSTLRRLHDNNVSRKNILWMFVPVIGPILLIAKLTFGPHSSRTPRGLRRAKVIAKTKQRDSMVVRGRRNKEED